MTKEEVFSIFKELIYDNSYAVSRDEEIKLDSNLVWDLDLDSLDRVDIVIAAEKRFNIELDENVIADLETVDEFVNLIVEKINAKK